MQSFIGSVTIKTESMEDDCWLTNSQIEYTNRYNNSISSSQVSLVNIKLNLIDFF